MRTDKPIGLYVHIPFCVKKCNYCDFASFSPSEEFRARYIDALTREIESYRGKGITLDTVFFGGGTPSLLEPFELKKIMSSVRSVFNLITDAEITAEVNPATLNEEKLLAFLSEGFNRFSIGLQSIHENEQKMLGRIHNFDDFLSTFKLLREHNAGNIGIDLMFGIPEQTLTSFCETLEEAVKLSPEHISVYGLILEEGTPFYANSASLKLPSEDEEREMYFASVKKLSEKGFCQYEISNFAKAGFECRHNLKYWRLDEYIGVGLAAHSYFDGVRFSNSAVKEDYFSGKGKSEEKQSLFEEMFEYTMLSLRTSYGLSLSEYKERFGCDFKEGRGEKILFYKKHGLLSEDDGRLFLTSDGFYLSNTVLADLI